MQPTRHLNGSTPCTFPSLTSANTRLPQKRTQAPRPSQRPSLMVGYQGIFSRELAPPGAIPGYAFLITIVLPAEFLDLAQQRFGIYAFREGEFEIMLARAPQKLRDDGIVGLLFLGVQRREDLVQSGHDKPHADLAADSLLKQFH